MLAYLHYPEERDPRAANLYALSVARGTGLRAAYTARSAARRLSRLGVREAVFPENYGYLDCFARRGVRPVDVRTLRRALGAELTLAALRALEVPPERAAVCFAAEYVDAAICAAVRKTAARVRYVSLDMGGAAALERSLRRTLGVAPCAPGKEDLRVCFDQTKAAQHALPLWNADYAPAYALAGGPIAEPLLAALWRVGRAEEITVRSVPPLQGV